LEQIILLAIFPSSAIFPRLAPLPTIFLSARLSATSVVFPPLAVLSPPLVVLSVIFPSSAVLSVMLKGKFLLACYH
jgi:hypothetical protein